MATPVYNHLPNVTEIPCPEDYHYEFFTADYTTDMYGTGSVGAEQAAEDDARLAANDMVIEIAKMVAAYLDAAKCQGKCTRTLIHIGGPEIVGPKTTRIPNQRHYWETVGYTATVHVTEYLIIGCNLPDAPPAKIERPKKGTINIK